MRACPRRAALGPTCVRQLQGRAEHLVEWRDWHREARLASTADIYNMQRDVRVERPTTARGMQ